MRAYSQERVEHGKMFLVRIVSMLTKLVDRLSPSTQMREVETGYLVEDEDRFAEDEDDDEKRISFICNVGINRLWRLTCRGTRFRT
jgi:hypothetical protein